MVTQDTPAEAWENYKNMVQDVCSNEEATLRSLFLDVKSSAARPDEALSTDVGYWFIDSAIRESSVPAARERARRAFCDHGLGTLFEEKNDRLKSELRELVKRTYQSCWKNKAD